MYKYMYYYVLAIVAIIILYIVYHRYYESMVNVNKDEKYYDISKQKSDQLERKCCEGCACSTCPHGVKAGDCSMCPFGGKCRRCNYCTMQIGADN